MLGLGRIRAPGKLAKLDSVWEGGVFLCYRGNSGEIIVGTARGVYRTRTAQRKPEEHRWSKSSLDMVGGRAVVQIPSEGRG